MMHTHWFRATIASIVLAILVTAFFGIPFFTALAVIGILYFVNRQFGAQTARNWATTALRVLGGLAIFLALRLLAAKVLGLYPVDTYPDGNLYGTILYGHDIKNTIIWEIIFTFVAGGLSVAWARGQHRKLVGWIFGFSLLVLSVQIGLPIYAASFPDRTQVSTTLIDKGVLGAGASGIKTLAFGKSADQGGNGKGGGNNNPPPPASNPPAYYNPTATYPPPPPEEPCKRPWSLKTVEIPPEGLPVFLCQGWQTQPFGGAIVIVNETTHQHLDDVPGVDNHFGFQANGMYTFHPNPEGEKRSVKILNRW